MTDNDCNFVKVKTFLHMKHFVSMILENSRKRRSRSPRKKAEGRNRYISKEKEANTKKTDQEKNFPWFLLKINSSSLEDLTVKNVRKSICRRIHDWSAITIPHISPAFSQSTSIIKRLYQVIWDKKRPVQHQILYWKIVAN
ncbi:hypothetical protein ROZALSC1DRAFT_25887, partial [Rozella allomycis CSF55]